jgi:hypothetical protein
MRNLFSLVAVSLAFLGSSSLANAGGLIQQLPKDGTSATFDMKMVARGMEGTGTLTVSSVGKVEEDGKPCRWIEIEMAMKIGELERTVIAKILIPEAELKAGKKPFDNRVRGWINMRGDVKALEQKDFGPLPAFFAGPLDNSKKLDAAEVESKALGKLKCEGVSGSVTYEDRRKNEVSIETRLHKSAPFGVVSSSFDLKSERNGVLSAEVEMKLTLKTVGKDAKSKLPDNN